MLTVVVSAVSKSMRMGAALSTEVGFIALRTFKSGPFETENIINQNGFLKDVNCQKHPHSSSVRAPEVIVS